MESIVLKIKSLIKSKGKSISEIAKALNLSRPTVYNILNERSVLSVEFLFNISNFLNVPVSSFFSDDDSLGKLITEIENLNEEIMGNAVKGKGLVSIDYDIVNSRFIKEYKELKSPLSKKEFESIRNKQSELMWKHFALGVGMAFEKIKKI